MFLLSPPNVSVAAEDKQRIAEGGSSTRADAGHERNADPIAVWPQTASGRRSARLPPAGRLVRGLILLVLGIFLGLLLVRLVVDWVQVFARSWTPRGPVLFVLEIVYSITDPPIVFVRRFVPPLRLGGVALDTSFLIVLVAVYLLRAVLARVLI